MTITPFTPSESGRRGRGTSPLVAAAAAIWLAAFGGQVSAQELPEEAREALTRASNAMRQQQWLLAEQQLKIAYDKRSDAPEILLALAQFNERKGGRDLIAAAWYRAYLASDPAASGRDQIKAKIAALEQQAISVANGLINRALSAASNIAASDRSNVLTNVAVAQAELGDVAAAFSTASSARSANPSSYGSDPFGNVAQTLASRGNLAGAEDALRRVDPAKRSSALHGVVTALTNAKRPADALAYAAPTSGSNRLYSYSYIAKAFSAAGDRSAARANLNTAVDAVYGMDQSGRRTYLKSLVETASDIGEFETARRLFADMVKLHNLNDKNDAYYVNSARWSLTKNLAKWGRLAEAEALFPSVFANDPNPSHAWYRSSAREDIESGHVRRTGELIKGGRLSDAEAALAKEPWPGAYGKPRVAVANAYLEKKDFAAARKVLDRASASLSKATVADAGTAFNYVILRRDLSNAYLKLGDLAASQRILDAVAGTVSRITDAERKKAPLQYTASAYNDLAKAYSDAKNFANAKKVAATVVRLINQMSSPDDRASALSALSSLDPQVGLQNELASALPGMPSGYYRKNVAQALVKIYASHRQDAEAVAAAGRIDDLNDRRSTLSTLVSARADAKDWKGALALANEPGVSGRLYAELAYKMLAQDLVKEAAELEARFTGGTSEADTYHGNLASRQAGENDVETALRTAARIASVPRRIRALFSVASTVETIAGRAAAKPIVERAIAQFAELKSAAERAETCNSVAGHLGHGSILSDALSGSGPQPEGSSIGVPCAAEALQIGPQNDRLSKAYSALSYRASVVRPPMNKALVPARRVMTRIIAEAQSFDSSSSTAAEAASRLAQDGAVEAALDMSGFLSGSYLANVSKAAVTWLVDAGDGAAAQRILGDYVAAIATDDSSKDSRYSSAVGIALIFPDFEQALKLASAIKSGSNRISPLLDIGRAAISRNRFEVALSALDRAKASAADQGRNYYLSIMSDMAAQAGDKNAESYIAEVGKQNGITAEVSARDTLIGELVKWKQWDRALALLPAQEADLAKLPAPERWSYRAFNFARHLASLGDTARLDKLVTAAPPPQKSSLWATAADAFIKAGRNDAAQVALARALEANNLVTQPGSKVSNLQSIASHYLTAGNVEVARTALARSIEAVAGIPSLATQSSYLRSAAGTYVKLGDEGAARASLKRSLDVLKLARPDFAGWADYTIAMAEESKDPAQAERRALAIGDAHWRARTIQGLYNARMSAKRAPEAVSILKSAQPSPMLDQSFVAAARFHLGKREAESARGLIGKIVHPIIRDELRRTIILLQARRESVEAALAEIATIEDKSIRAYTLIDIGRLLASRSTDKRSQAAYFSQLAFFVAAKLAEQTNDAQLKIDILAATAHGQNTLDPNLAKRTLAKAEALAPEIPDERARVYAVRWAKPPEASVKPRPAFSDERNEWSYRARSTLDNNQYKDVEAFVQSLMTKNPTERANNLAQAAGSYGIQIGEMRRKAAEFAKRQEAFAR